MILELVDYADLANLNLTRPPLVTGSYVVDREKANDIDVVIVYHDRTYQCLSSMGYIETSKEGYEPDPTLLTTWRKGDINVIVVRDHTAYMLWEVFTNIISDTNEYTFTEKQDRIKLHEHIKKAYR